MKKILFFAFAGLFFLSSCSTTKITADNRDADIYIGTRKLGKGEVSIPKTGLPVKRTLTAKYNGKDIGKVEIKRRFTVSTAIIGVLSGYTGFIWAWEYPDYVVIPTDPVENKSGGWDAPPSKWDK